MSRPLVGLLIAVLVTFVAAPSTSLAAANSLSAAAVSPTSGGPGTVVTLAVTYTGSHPATSVRAMVGAITVPLVRTSGTENEGRWSGATTPPVGTWRVTFTARTDQGNAPSLDGATVTILAAVAPPSVSPKLSIAPSASEPIGDGANGNDGSGDGAGGAPAPAATSQAAPAAPPSANPVPPPTTRPNVTASRSAAPAGENGTAQPPSAAASSPSDTSEAMEGRSAPAVPRASASSASSASHVSPSLSGTGSSAPVPGRASRGEDAWLLPTIMTLTVTLASLLAIAGAGMLLSGRRRQETEAASAPSVSLPAADDPIVAAMGIAPETALRARRARRLRDALDERAATESALSELDPPVKPTRTRPRRSPKG